MATGRRSSVCWPTMRVVLSSRDPRLAGALDRLRFFTEIATIGFRAIGHWLCPPAILLGLNFDRLVGTSGKGRPFLRDNLSENS
jgi:hypothetical protein